MKQNPGDGRLRQEITGTGTISIAAIGGLPSPAPYCTPAIKADRHSMQQEVSRMRGQAFTLSEGNLSGGAYDPVQNRSSARLPGLFRHLTHPRISILPIAELFAQIALGFSRSADHDFFAGAIQGIAETGCWSGEVAEALSVLLPAYDREASLSALGRFAARWDVARCLTNLYRLNVEEARTLAILDEPIEAPVIITGLPRTGSTFLHRLL